MSDLKYPAAPRIYKSEDYSEFKFLKFNRQLNESNINKIVLANIEKFEMHLFPIVCDNKMNIVDGQHRFEACKKLECPVYYVKAKDNDKTSWVDVNRVNKAGLKHVAKDILYMMYKSDNPEAKEIYRIWEEYTDKKLNLGILARLIHCHSNGGHGLNSDLRKGILKLDYLEETIDILNFVNSLDIEVKDKFTGPFLYALVKIIKNSSMNKFDLFAKFKEHEHVLSQKRHSCEGYYFLFKQVHNLYLKKNKID